MANQTFVSIMTMIKNLLFCVAKAKVDIPGSEFFLILLGTDRLEKLFGLIRTAIGTDSNFDILQLCGRASNLTEVYIILGLKPEWDRGPRRLNLRAVINEQGDVSPNADHISPASWRGDLCVDNVNLHSCWLAGRVRAEAIIPGGRAALQACARVPGFDILSPFGKLLVNVPDTADAFEVDPELPRPDPHAPAEFSAPNTSNDLPESTANDPPEPTKPTLDTSEISGDDAEDLDDLLAIHETGVTPHSPHVLVNGKKVSKASILKDLM